MFTECPSLPVQHNNNGAPRSILPPSALPLKACKEPTRAGATKKLAAIERFLAVHGQIVLQLSRE